MQTTNSGLQFDDVVIGKGTVAKAGADVAVHYTGWLWKDGAKGAKLTIDMTMVSDAKTRGRPL